MPEEKCFINLMEQTNAPKTLLTAGNPHSYICVKSFYKELGMGFVTVDIDKSFKG